MMEDNTDDQSSGWFEVKKKHRRFSIQGLVSEFSNKGPSQSSVHGRSANSHSKQKFHVSKAEKCFSTHAIPGSGNSIPELKEVEKVLPCFDKCVVTEHIEPPSSHSANFTSMASSNKSQNVQVAVQKERLPRIPKIKWGDLEDDVLLVRPDNLDGTEIGLCDLGDETSLTCRKSEDLDESVSANSCCIVPQEDKAVVTLAKAEHPSARNSLLVQRDKPYKEVCKNIRESCPSDNMLSDENDEMLRSDDPCLEEITQTHVKIVDGNARDELNSSNQDKENNLSLPLEEAGVPIATLGNHDKPKDGCVTISSVPVEQLVSSATVDNQDNLPSVMESVPELSGNDSIPIFKDSSGSPDGIVNADKTTTENMDVTEEGESSESEERFRERLWCFLFENLNRSLDELYLLCELECDLEQLNEAILVLEEAGSDFKELKSRVEGFEIVKKPSQSLDGLPVNGKIDHRRAHALSWEVRRMAASPHRAEILSSSLEAFKKIQKERTGMRTLQSLNSTCADHHLSADGQGKLVERNDGTENVKETVMHSKKQAGVSDLGRGHSKGGKKNMEGRRSSKAYVGPQGSFSPPSSSTLDPNASHASSRVGPGLPIASKNKGELQVSASELENQVPKKDKIMIDSRTEKNPKYMDPLKRHLSLLEKAKDGEKEKEKEKEKRDSASWRSLDAWKKKRNWEDILTSPLRLSSRVSHSPGMSRKNMERTRVLHDKLMSPEKKKKTASDLKKEAEEKHARATRIRSELENERLQRLQRTSEKLIRVNEWQAVRTVKLKEGMHARHQRSESRHEAYLAQVVRRAGDESSKVNEVRFITSLNEENKKHILRQKLHDSKVRRAEKLHIIKTKQKEDSAREEAVSERRRLLQAEKLQRLAEIQKKKEEAQIRREEERKASSAAREARAIEQLRRKEIRAKVQQEEAELLAQKLAERLSESEQRRKIYLEQIRERASMDFRDQSSPLLRRSSNKDSLTRSTSASNVEDYYTTNTSSIGGSFLGIGDTALQHSLKRKIKKIRQKLMALKHEFNEPPVSAENAGSGYNSLIGNARAKIGRWIQDLQRFRQARKEGASSIGLIVIDMIKFLEGKETELHASRQVGLLDFLASALPASHTSKPEACQVTTYLLRLLKVVVSMPENRSYFLAQNLLPPVIPMLSAALENYIKIAASVNIPGNTNTLSGKTSVENFDSVSEVLEGFIWTVTTIMGHTCSDERQVQMKDFLLELLISYQVIHRLRELFALHDRPQVEGSPFPLPIILSLNMLVVLTSRPETVSFIDWGTFPSKVSNEKQDLKNVKSVDIGDPCTDVTARYPLSESCDTRDVPQYDVAGDGTLGECITRRRESSLSNDRNFEKDRTDISLPLQMHVQNLSGKFQNMKQAVVFLLSVIAETGLVSLPSLLTAVLLQANNRLSSEQGSYVLPSNFEEVATGVLKVLNNLALLDITFMQRMLARPDLKMEFFHLMSFLLSHCTNKWKSATDQVGMLLLESLLLLGYFALFHPGNQAVLHWGKSPTILHKVCDLPFVFFSDSELMPILAGTLVSACYGCEQNRGVVQQELSTEMLLSLVGSCRNTSRTNPFPSDNPTANDPCEGSQSCNDSKKFQVEFPVKSARNNPKSTRLSLSKGGASGSNARVSKVRNSRDVKTTKTCEQWALKQNLQTLETSSTLMLHSRFPTNFIDKAEEFFSAAASNLSEGS